MVQLPLILAVISKYYKESSYKESPYKGVSLSNQGVGQEGALSLLNIGLEKNNWKKLCDNSQLQYLNITPGVGKHISLLSR